MTSDEATTKGTILRSLVKFVQSDLSREEYAKALAELRPSDQQLVNQDSILATQKIPEATLNRLTVAAAQAKGESLESFGRRAGSAELADAVGIYRFFTLILTPPALLKRASTLWSTVHSTGRLIVEDATSNSARVRLADFPSEPAHCARMSGWFEGAGKMTGAKNATVDHDICLARGGPDCQWKLTW